MNIIVTSNNIEYSGFLKVRSLKEALATVGSIDILVYHKSEEPREEKVELLTKLKSRVGRLIYVRYKDNIDQAVQMMVLGADGKYIDDEFFLESSDELKSLINDIDVVTELAELGGVSVLGDFFERYLKNGSSEFNGQYLAVVKDAVRELVEQYEKKDLEIIKMSETASELFTHSAELLSSLREEDEALKQSLQKLEAFREYNAITSTVSSSNQSILFFPQVNYPKEKSIIRVKAVGTERYLVSFLMGMRIYLENIMNVRPKLICVFPVGQMYEDNYKGYNWVTQKTFKSLSNYYNSIVFTNYPNKDVLGKLLDDTDYDTFIVLDVLKSDKNHILNCKGAEVKYAVGSGSLINKFNLKPKNCFTTVVSIPGVLFTIPIYPNYPTDADQRERLYLRECNNFYEKLYITRRK